MSVWAIVVAAGSGTRFGGPKQYQLLRGRRVLDWAIADARDACDGVVLVVHPDRLGEPEPAADFVVAGGSTRSGSVRAGLAAVPDDADTIVVHDAARPLAGPAVFQAVLDAVSDGYDGAVPGLPLVDTIRSIRGGTLERSELVAVQTPQAFRADSLRGAHRGDPEGTDDASLVEASGGMVTVVPGHRANLKITEPFDLAFASLCLEQGVGG